MTDAERFRALRAVVILYMSEEHMDWADIWEAEVAKLCEVPPAEEPFCWRWAEVRNGITVP